MDNVAPNKAMALTVNTFEVATVIATKTSRTTVGALTIAVVTVVELTALTFTAATVAAVQRLAAGASR